MEILKESSPLEILAKYNKTSKTIYFSIKNNYDFKAHSFLINRNLTEKYSGTFKSGIFLDLKDFLNLKQFKIEISEIR